MLGLPTTSLTIQALADVIREEDEFKEKNTIECKTLHYCVPIGLIKLTHMCSLSDRDFVEATESITVAYSDDFQFEKNRYKKEMPSGAFIITTGDKDNFIVVNRSLVEWFTENGVGGQGYWRHSIASSILLHELGHYLEGHHKTHPGLSLDNLSNQDLVGVDDIFPLLAKALLHGGVFKRELEADLRAMRVRLVYGTDVACLDSSVFVAMRTYLAEMSDTLGIRLEQNNRALKLSQMLNYQESTDDRSWTEAEIEILSMSEFDENIIKLSEKT